MYGRDFSACPDYFEDPEFSAFDSMTCSIESLLERLKSSGLSVATVRRLSNSIKKVHQPIAYAERACLTVNEARADQNLREPSRKLLFFTRAVYQQEVRKQIPFETAESF